MEIGFDTDVDATLRSAVVEAVGELLDEDSDEIVGAVLLWCREEDGDLVDLLLDARDPLADDGVVWLLTPKAGRPGHIEPADIEESYGPRRPQIDEDPERLPGLGRLPHGRRPPLTAVPVVARVLFGRAR